MTTVEPDVVIHQLTDLPFGLDPKLMAEATVRNARMRSEGTKNLVDAAVAAGARRVVAQSIAWAYAPGPQPYSDQRVCAQAIISAPADYSAGGSPRFVSFTLKRIVPS